MRSLLALLMLSLPALAEVGPERAEKLEHILIQDCGSCHGLTMKGGLGSPLPATYGPLPPPTTSATAPTTATVLLDSLRGVWDETAVDEWDHALQAAACAIADGAACSL